MLTLTFTVSKKKKGNKKEILTTEFLLRIPMQ